MSGSSEFLEVGGAKLYYQDAGAGHPLVLIHGGLVDSGMWDDQFEVLAAHYRVIRYDLRWFGRSTASEVEYSNIEDLFQLLTQLQIEKAFLVGLSLGGSIALDFTLEHPEIVDALILVGAGVSGDTQGISSDVQGMYEELLKAYGDQDLARAVEVTLRMWTDGPKRTAEEVEPEVRERIRMMSEKNLAARARRPSGIDPPAISRLAEVEVPTLVMVGELDNLMMQDLADRLVNEIRKATKVTIPRAAHHPNMERPDEFNSILLNFFGELAGP